MLLHQEVEEFGASLDYNSFLGISRMYAMMTVVSNLFCIIYFPHEGRIMTIDKVVSNLSDETANPGSMVPWIEQYHATTESIGCGIYPSLMGYFDFPASIFYVHATPINRVASFRMTYIGDPWTLPSPYSIVEGQVHVRMENLYLQLR
jgi:hypothetical protein